MEAVVVKATDGDIIELGGQNVRMQGVAAPARNQPHGNKATADIKFLILHRRLQLEMERATEDVAKAVELLRAYMWDLREARPEDPTIQEIERVIHHLGYPIVRPDQIIK